MAHTIFNSGGGGNQMPEVVEINKDTGVIEVRSFGDVSLDDLDRTVTEINHIYEEHGIDRVLVDVRNGTSMPNTVELFYFAQSLPDVMRIAIWVAQDQMTMAKVQFVRTVASNRGQRIQIFSTHKDALEWLVRSDI